VIRQYTAGQTAELSGSIDVFEWMSKSTEPEPLNDHLHQFTGPVRLLVVGVDPAEVPDEQRELPSPRTPSPARASPSTRNRRTWW
jgi:hypothetical protein